MWIDVTWGAGGSTAETTQLLCETAMDVTGLDVLMPLTCTNVTVETTRKVLQRCKDKGLCNAAAPCAPWGPAGGHGPGLDRHGGRLQARRGPREV